MPKLIQCQPLQSGWSGMPFQLFMEVVCGAWGVLCWCINDTEAVLQWYVLDTVSVGQIPSRANFSATANLIHDSRVSPPARFLAMSI